MFLRRTLKAVLKQLSNRRFVIWFVLTQIVKWVVERLVERKLLHVECDHCKLFHCLKPIGLDQPRYLNIGVCVSLLAVNYGALNQIYCIVLLHHLFIKEIGLHCQIWSQHFKLVVYCLFQVVSCLLKSHLLCFQPVISTTNLFGIF